jgi:hypothetical protein
MGVSLGTYIVTIIFFAAVIFVIIMFGKKPNSKQPDYLMIDELETTGWEIVDEIRRVGEEYGEKLSQAKKDVDQTLDRIEQFEQTLSKWNSIESTLDEKQALLEYLFNKTKEELEETKTTRIVEEKLQESAKKVEKETIDVQVEEVKEEIKEEIKKERPKPTLKRELKTMEDKKIEVYRLFSEGYTIEEIAHLTETHKGFVEVLLNMKKMKKNG